MQIFQSNKFKKAYKKLHANQRQELNKALEQIISDPEIGEQKKGSLVWLKVHKCKIVNQLTLIGYSVDDDKLTLTFVAIGSHENFYRALNI
ncbi:MAG: type II toxin-antitoxin system RelE/ParE family toxin [Alphaproteobacteria bacterium]|nr:type II toxin-antitoxin system RelE/ParE family toxin [Alphaproteobacteria bacterium]